MNKRILSTLSVLIMLAGCTGRTPILGVEHGKLKPCPSTPNCVNSQTIGEDNFIDPIRVDFTTPETQQYLLEILKQSKKSKIITIEDNYIRAEYVSKILRFVDDVEFYFPDIDSDTMVIHVRSASRVGYYDFGVNRKRLEQIRSALRTYMNENK